MNTTDKNTCNEPISLPKADEINENEKMPESAAVKKSAASLDNDAGKTKEKRKLPVLLILEVLRKYSHEDNRLSLDDIAAYLRSDYSVECDRKSIMRNILILLEHGCRIMTSEEGGRKYFLDQKKITPKDMFLILEGLMSSKYITSGEMNALTARLSGICVGKNSFGAGCGEGLVSRYIYPKVFVHENISVILTAVSAGKKVSFVYNEYNKEKIMSPCGDAFSVSPYAVVNIENEYYLAAKKGSGKKDSMECYKISMISEIRATDEPADDIKTVEGFSSGFDSVKFASMFVSPFRGELLTCHVNILTKSLPEVIDYFGDSLRLIDEEGDYMLIEIVTNEEKMYKWAIANADISEIIFPQVLRFRVKDYFDINSWKYR